MCCGTGHLDGLVASGYRDAVAALGAYMKGAGPLSSGYSGGYQSQTYATPDALASPLERSVYQGGVVEYDLKVNGQGQVTGYMVVIKTPGPAATSPQPIMTQTSSLPQCLGMNPPPRTYNVPMGNFATFSNGPTSMVLYDAQTKELVHLDGGDGNGMNVNGMNSYDNDSRVLRSSSAEHRVISQEAIRKRIIDDLFNRPPVEQKMGYGMPPPVQEGFNPHPMAQVPSPMALNASPRTDYSASSRLKQMIAKRKGELGVSQDHIEGVKQRLLIDEAVPVENQHHVQFTHA